MFPKTSRLCFCFLFFFGGGMLDVQYPWKSGEAQRLEISPNVFMYVKDLIVAINHNILCLQISVIFSIPIHGQDCVDDEDYQTLQARLGCILWQLAL